jgi:hypothetical protein
VTMSLIKPRMRLPRVPSPTTPADLTICEFSDMLTISLTI